VLNHIYILDGVLLGVFFVVTWGYSLLVEPRDRALAHAPQAADLADRHADGLRELEKAKENSDALQSDRDAARKRFEDAKMRLERSEQKVRELGDESASFKPAHARELEAVARRHSERDAETAALHQQALDRHRAESAAQLAAELAQKRDEAERVRSAALAELRAALESDAAQRVADAQAKHDALISQVMAAHSNELANTRKSLEEKHETEQRQTTERSQQELSRVGRALAETETRIQLLQDQLEEAESARSDLSTRLAKMTAERDQKTELSEELQAQLSRLAALRGEEEHVLERARKAFAIGLSLLEDHRRGSG
jgi:chromosome segregation ATPase